MVLLATAVSALGVSPGQKIIDFEPGVRHTIQFNVLNDQHKDIMLMIYSLGEMNGSVTLPTQLLLMPSDESSRRMSYEVELPKELPPGDHTVEVVMQEINPNAPAPGVGVKTQLAVATRLVVRVPYPDKYLEIGKIEVMDQDAEGYIEFRLPVQNYGKEAIEAVEAEFTINDPEGKNVGKMVSQEAPLDTGKRTLLKAKWQADVTPGEYTVVARVIFDDSYKMSDATAFNVGDVDIEILNIETKNFNLGEVAKVDITMVSKWNRKIEDAYVTMEILDEDGEGKANVKTPTFNLVPHERKTVPAYWDTAGFDTGSYHITLEIHFLDKIITKHIRAELSLDQISFGFLDATGNVVAMPGKIDRTTILSVLIIVLITINIMWFVYYKRRGSKKYGTVAVGPAKSPRVKRHLATGTGEYRKYDAPAVDEDKLLENMRKARGKKRELVKKVQEFKKQYKDDKLTYSEYEYKLNHYLRGKDVEYWKKYYDDYVKDAKEYLRDHKMMKPPSGPE